MRRWPLNSNSRYAPDWLDLHSEALVGALIEAPKAPGRCTIDNLEELRELPGVKAIFTARDVPSQQTPVSSELLVTHEGKGRTSRGGHLPPNILSEVHTGRKHSPIGNLRIPEPTDHKRRVYELAKVV